MLSKVFTIASKGMTLARPASAALVQSQQRTFRMDFLNPYLHNPIILSEQERVAQESKPVWERTFDWKKYMEHDGPLKLSTGIAHLDVEPFPRMKLMKLYYLTIEELKDLPDKYGKLETLHP